MVARPIRKFIQHSLLIFLRFLKDSLWAGEYASCPGLLQACDPRIKILAILLLLLAVMFSKSCWFLVALYLLSLVLAKASSLPLGFFLKRTWVFMPLFSLMLVWPAIFSWVSPGEPLFSFHGLPAGLAITRPGVASAGILFLRVLVSVSLAVLMTLTTKHALLLKALRWFGLSRIFVMILGMSLRYIYLLLEKVEHFYLAIKSRTGQLISTKEARTTVLWNAAELWRQAYYLHLGVHAAMLSRGYAGEPMVLDEFRVRGRDWVCLGMAAATAGVTLWQNWFLILNR